MKPIYSSSVFSRAKIFLQLVAWGKGSWFLASQSVYYLLTPIPAPRQSGGTFPYFYPTRPDWEAFKKCPNKSLWKKFPLSEVKHISSTLQGDAGGRERDFPPKTLWKNIPLLKLMQCCLQVLFTYPILPSWLSRKKFALLSNIIMNRCQLAKSSVEKPIENTSTHKTAIKNIRGRGAAFQNIFANWS